MFDEHYRLDDAALLAGMSEALRVERAAAARRLVAVGVLTQRRIADAKPERQYWCVEDWEALAGEVGAELGVSRGRASAAMSTGETLVTRLPRLAERFLAGDLDVRVFTTIDFRTANVTDYEILDRLDRILARPTGAQLERPVQGEADTRHRLAGAGDGPRRPARRARSQRRSVPRDLP